jgi:hypothetical protein
MSCTRCNGLMVMEAMPGHWWWRCINCGDRVDRSILLNRAEQAAFADGLREARDRDLLEWSRWFSVRVA